MPTNIVTPQTLKNGYQVCDTANAAVSDAPGVNVKLLFTAGASGAVIYGVKATPRATVTATRLGLWLSKDGGDTIRLFRQATMAAATVSTTAGAASTDVGGFTETSPYRLEPNDRLYCDIGVSLAAGIVFEVQAEGLA